MVVIPGDPFQYQYSTEDPPSDLRNPSGNPSDLDIFDTPHIATPNHSISGSFSSFCKKGPNAAS